MTITKTTLITAVVAFVLGAVLMLFSGGVRSAVGATGGLLAENYLPFIMYNDGFNTQKPVKIGTNGSAVSKRIVGSCDAIQAVVGSHTASSTKQFYCAVTGVVAGDNVQVSLPVGAGINAHGAGSPAEGFQLISAYATSSGMIGFSILNGVGTATSSYTQATSSVTYVVEDIQ